MRLRCVLTVRGETKSSHRGFHLGHPGEAVITPAGVRGRFGEVADEPAPHHGVIRGVGGIKEPLGDLERFGMARCTEGGQDTPWPRERRNDVGLRPHADLLRARGGAFGRVRVAAHPERTVVYQPGKPAAYWTGDVGPVPAPVAWMAAAMSDRSSSFNSRAAAGRHPST